MAGELVAVPGKVYAELARRGGQAEATLGFQNENLTSLIDRIDLVDYGDKPRDQNSASARLIHGEVVSKVYLWHTKEKNPYSGKFMRRRRDWKRDSERKRITWQL